ncbi:hypothetical protein [Thalassospira marina]|uniref:Uncharacterized protein n=1 Tax=Thalassospira marina TaxID=2048283 RepID=A0A2N3KDC3_9PROT|nr:hypothetical protein [Thalassospira marina]PKR48443.1 hypothetical protein COO20_24590 [Thalassospira marina]
MSKIPAPHRSTKGEPPASADIRHNLQRPEGNTLKPLNFKVSPEFHREFKSLAASHGVSMLDLLREGFELVKTHRG